MTDAVGGGLTAIRPDAARIVPTDPLPSGARVGVVVARTSRRGRWRLRIRVDDGAAPWELDVEERAGTAPALGASVAFAIDPDDVIRL